ncbi:MAG TPA: TolC family protein [Polyangia bacterium]|nr:TolC family protein [Polyangia bacterium]
MKSRRLIGIFLALVLCSTHVAWAVDERPLRALTLEQALAELDSQSPTLVQVRSRVADARALATQARVPLIPTVVASGGYTRNSADARVDFAGTPLASLHPGALVIQPLGVWTVAGTVRVPLIIPNAWADWSAAQRAADAVAATAESARLQLRASLAQSAWAAAAAEEIVAVSERAVAVAEEHQRSAARGVTAGTEAPLSVLKAETEVVKRQSDLAQARANRERSHLALGVLLGKTDPVRVLLPPEPGSEAARDVESLVAEALQSRPEIAAQVAQIRAAQSQATAARLRWLPQISGSGTVFAADAPYPTGKKEGWRLTLDALWPLYDGGLAFGKHDQAEAALVTARAADESQRLGIVQEVQDTRRDVSVAKERLRLAEQQRDLATAAAASAKRTFEAGVASSLEVLDANDRSYQADVAMADARGRLGIARVALGRALGRRR